MRVVIQDKNIFLLRFDKDEEIIKGLTDFCLDKNIKAGSFSAIGAAKNVVLSYYNLKTKEYQDMEIEEDVEIVGILGNVATMNEKTMIHCHGSFSDENFVVKAGHVKKLIVSATCEVSVNILQGKIERTFDEKQD